MGPGVCVVSLEGQAGRPGLVRGREGGKSLSLGGWGKWRPVSTFAVLEKCREQKVQWKEGSLR